MSAEILVLNAGSSSLKVSLFAAAPEPQLLFRSNVDGLGPAASHHDALVQVVSQLTQQRSAWQPTVIGHRIVHGGTRFQAPVLIDPSVRDYLASIVPLAPLHQPGGLAGIDAAARAFPGVRQVACFDTAFHATRTFAHDAYALPREFYEAGVRRYGFHGLSYASIVTTLRRIAPERAEGRLIVCHLGNGASLCAIHQGRCIETTMGFTALDGLPMGTRCGQIDPGVLLYLLSQRGMTVNELSDLLYKRSGLAGLSGIGSDMRDLLNSATTQAKEALEHFLHRTTLHIGMLAAALGGVETLIFTAGIGEHSATIRGELCRRASWLGVSLDEQANERGERVISTDRSKTVAMVVPTQEEAMIAKLASEVAGIKG
jgi:acetate kinase